ncbi:hypothetical protein GCM10015536_60990 [Streptomyces griseomycini]|nr:hypothetical protein GCM10015536_60990 [Streptomyces griseomycini]
MAAEVPARTGARTATTATAPAPAASATSPMVVASPTAFVPGSAESDSRTDGADGAGGRRSSSRTFT